jgi:hypothetical protein
MATDTHSEYVILIAFPLQQWLNKRATLLRHRHIACLSSLILAMQLSEYCTTFAVSEHRVWNLEEAITYMCNSNVNKIKNS